MHARQTDTQTADIQTYREKKEREKKRDLQIYLHADEQQTDRQIAAIHTDSRHTYRHTDSRHTDRYIDNKYTHRQTLKQGSEWSALRMWYQQAVTTQLLPII